MTEFKQSDKLFIWRIKKLEGGSELICRIKVVYLLCTLLLLYYVHYYCFIMYIITVIHCCSQIALLITPTSVIHTHYTDCSIRVF